MNVKELLLELTKSQKAACVVSTVTTGTGLGKFLNMLPHYTGQIATVAGIVLSIVLIYTHWRKGRVEYRKTRLEIRILREKEAESIEAALERDEKEELEG